MTSATTTVASQVKANLERVYRSWDRTLVIAVSGGVDSQVLAHALLQVVGESGPELHVVHVDHGLRPGSGGDAQQVEALCQQWRLPCEVISVDVAGWDRVLGQGLESAARAARYAALALAAIRLGTDTVATGHTLDDQVETILLRLISGSALEGLGGIEVVSRRSVPIDPERTSTQRLTVFRPLRGLSRSEISAYAAENGLVPVEDESNEDLTFPRNAVRKRVIPALHEIEPSFRQAIDRTTALLREDARFIGDVVDETFEETVAERSGIWLVEREQFRLAHQAIQWRVLFRVIEPLLSLGTRLSRERVEALRNAANNGQPGTTIELAEDLVGYVDYDRVALGHVETLESTLRQLSWIPLIEPGTEIQLHGDVDIQLDNGWRIRGSAPESNGLVLRTRRHGDRIRRSGKRDTKLQDFLVDRKVPRYVRDWLPMVVLGDEIRWIAGLDLTEFASAKDGIYLHVEIDATSMKGSR